MKFYSAQYPDGRFGYPQATVEEAKKELEEAGYDTSDLVEDRGIWYSPTQLIGISLLQV